MGTTECSKPQPVLYNYVQRIKDQYIQRWRIECENNSKLKTCYIFYKNSYDIEQYVYDIDIVKFRRILASFRSDAHCLSIAQQQQYQLDEHEFYIYLPFVSMY